MAHPATCKIVDGKDYEECIWVGNLLSVSVNASSCLDSNLLCANNVSCDVSSNKLFLVGKWALSLKMAISLATMFSIRSIAYLGVFILILPPAEASRSCLDYGLNPSIKILSFIGSKNREWDFFLTSLWIFLGPHSTIHLEIGEKNLLASPDNENENKLNRIASSGTPANRIVLHISM